MITYQYTDASNMVVHVIDEDGVSRMSMLASVLPEDAVIEPYVVSPPPVPTIVTRFQARAALVQAGYFTQIDDFMAALPKTDIRRMAWEDATEFDRTSTTLLAMQQMLGLSDSQVDDLFVLAYGIQA